MDKKMLEYFLGQKLLSPLKLSSPQSLYLFNCGIQNMTTVGHTITFAFAVTHQQNLSQDQG